MRRNFRRTTLSLIIFTLFLAGMMLPAGRAEIMAEETMPKAPVTVAASYSNSKGKGMGIATTWDCIHFGNYVQTREYDENGNYVKTPIKWRVLDVKPNGEALLLADSTLLNKSLLSGNNIMWATSELRTYLNDVFYNNAFSAAERADILTAHLVNEDNPKYGTDGGPDTDDKIFLLSVSEAMNPKYGFAANEYAAHDTRVSHFTPFSSRTAFTGQGGSTYSHYTTWFLRTPGAVYEDSSITPMVYVDGSGSISLYGSEGHEGTQYTGYGMGIRPALGINLKTSKNWAYAGKERSDFTGRLVSINDVYTGPKDPSYDSFFQVSYEYTGNPIKPAIIVSYHGIELEKGTDYTITYSNNIEVGKGTITLTGIGLFKDTKTISFSITETTRPFLKKNSKYYYTGVEPATGKTYNLGAELVIDRDITIPPGTKVTAKKITIKKGSGTKLGWVTMLSGSSLISKGTMSVSGHLDMATGSTLTASDKITIDDGIVSQSGNSKFKSKKAISIKGSAIYELREKSQLTAGTTLSIGGSAKFNMSGNATVDTAKFSYSSSKSGQITGGTIKASGDVTLGKKFNSTGTNVLRIDGSDKQKLTLPKGSKVICLSFEDRSLNKVTIGGSGQVKKLIVDPKKLGLSKELKEDDYHKYFSISKIPAHDSGIDWAIETALYLKLTDKKLGVNDLLKDFYSSMKGKAKFGSNKFNIPVIVKLKKGGYERGHISCDGFSFNDIGFCDVVYESGSKKYKLAVTTSMFNNQKAVDKFMKGLSKDGAKEIKTETRNFVEGCLLAAFGEISDACSFEKGKFAVELRTGRNLAGDYWSLLTKMNRVNSKLK